MRIASRATDQAERRRGGLAALLLLLAVALLALPGAAIASGITNAGSDLRDGWYGDQPDLSPDVVGGGTFGQLWSHQIYGQVYAQPLVVGSSVIVVTESNWVYSLDAETGAEKWSYHIPGTTWKPDDAPCWDLYPEIGATATPVIDEANHTMYFTHKVYDDASTSTPKKAKIFMDALDTDTGAIKSGFPVELQGVAQNANRTFYPTMQMQRPGLLMMDGVVYAAMGSVCDASPWQGWIFGVATDGSIKSRFVTLSSSFTDGGGIWQAGSGIMSDGSGRMFVATGNGGAPTGTIAGDTPPGDLGESVVRLDVQSDGSLKPADFFAPYDASSLDTWDADFAAGGVTALRDDVFGTSSVPHVALAVGKSGYLYMLNRDDLGGIGTGTANGDRVVQRIGPRGGVWSRPGVWPGDGGYVYIPTASGGDSAWGSSGLLDVYQNSPTSSGPGLSRVAPTNPTSSDAFGFGSSAPVITSDGMTSGSALVWTVWMAKGDGKNAQLRAYDAVPQSGSLHLRGSWPIAEASKFNPPGVGNGRIYVGTRDGHVLGFGAPITSKLSGGSATFPTTTVGDSSQKTITLKANTALTINAVSATPSTFSADTSAAGLPAALTAGQTLQVPVTFTPTTAGTAAGTLTVDTDQGTFTFTLTAYGQAAGAQLGCAPKLVAFGGVVVNQTKSDTIRLCNQGGQTLTINSIDLPSSPAFHLTDVPSAGYTIASGASVTIPVDFAPTTVDTFTDQVVVHSSGGDATIGLSGTSGTGPKLEITPMSLPFGDVEVGSSKTLTYTVTNSGDTAMTLTKSKPPALGQFVAADVLDEGTLLAPGESRTVHVRFQPTVAGAATDGWIITANDGSGPQTVAFAGNGVTPAPVVSPTPDPTPTPTPTDTGTGTSTGGGGGGSGFVPQPPDPGLPVPAALKIVKAKLAKDRRTLTVSGTVASPATAKIKVTLSAKLHGKTVKVTLSVKPSGGRWLAKVKLSSRLRGARSATLSVAFGGDPLVLAQTRHITVRLRR